MGLHSERPESIDTAKELLQERLCHHSLPLQIYGYQDERRQLLDLIRRTAVLGESNSILVIGPRGSGKSMMLRSVLVEVKQESGAAENLMEVHLNGLLQTGDRIALKEITKQLKLENVVGDQVFGSFAENLQFLLDALKSGGKHTKSILFILEEFDLFAHHKNQTLLYNLFDVSQSAQTPICVLGLTARLDVIELLEKRVKSRFSHRQLHLLPALTFDDYLQVCQDCLSLPQGFPDKHYVKEWKKHLQALLKEDVVQDTLRRQFNLDKDVRALQALLVLPVCRLSPEQPFPAARDFVDSSKQRSTDSKAAMLHGVSVLELSLVIAMKHLTEIYEGEPFNFEIVFKEYQKFAQRKSSMQVFEKAVVLKAFEHLCTLELVCAVDGAALKTQKEYRLMNLLVDTSQIMDALQKYPGCPTEVKQWGLSSYVT